MSLKISDNIVEIAFDSLDTNLENVQKRINISIEGFQSLDSQDPLINISKKGLESSIESLNNIRQTIANLKHVYIKTNENIEKEEKLYD